LTFSENHQNPEQEISSIYLLIFNEQETWTFNTCCFSFINLLVLDTEDLGTLQEVEECTGQYDLEEALIKLETLPCQTCFRK
jgi:hypothetical protein